MSYLVKTGSWSLMTMFVAASAWQCHVLFEWRQGAHLQCVINSWPCLFQRIHDSAMSYLSEDGEPVSHDSVCLSWQCLLQRVHDSAMSYLSEDGEPIYSVWLIHNHVCFSKYMTEVLEWRWGACLQFIIKPWQCLLHILTASTWQCHVLLEWRWGACLQFIIKPWQCLLQQVHDNAMPYLSEDREPVSQSHDSICCSEYIILFYW